MRLSHAVLLTILVASDAYASRPSLDLQQPASDPCLLQSFIAMVREAHVGPAGSEIAAFITAGENASLQLARWPSRAGVLRETFRGPIPADVVAIVHTHPHKWPHPSDGDVREAVRTGLPIYVISQSDVWVVDPASGKQIKLARAWRAAAQRGHCGQPASLNRADLRQH